MPCEKLDELGLLSLEKRRLKKKSLKKREEKQVDQCVYTSWCSLKMMELLFSVECTETRGSDCKLKCRKAHVNI